MSQERLPFTLGIVLPRQVSLDFTYPLPKQAFLLSRYFADCCVLSTTPRHRHGTSTSFPTESKLVWASSPLTALYKALKAMDTNSLVLAHLLQTKLTVGHIHPLTQYYHRDSRFCAPPVGYVNPMTQRPFATPSVWHKNHAALLEPFANSVDPLSLVHALEVLRAILYDPGRASCDLELVTDSQKGELPVASRPAEAWQVGRLGRGLLALKTGKTTLAPTRVGS